MCEGVSGCGCVKGGFVVVLREGEWLILILSKRVILAKTKNKARRKCFLILEKGQGDQSRKNHLIVKSPTEILRKLSILS